MLTYNKIAGQNIQRIEAISDGVFAVELTLLVLDLKVPAGEAIRSEADLTHSFLPLLPRLLVYFLSFMTVDIFWTGQSAQFHYINKSDRNLNWISLLFLLFVSIVPFTTAFLSEHIAFKFSIFVYWLNILFLGTTLYINWWYVTKNDFVNLSDDEKTSVSKTIKKRIITAQLLYACGASLCLMNIYLSIAAIIAIQLNYAFAFISPGKQMRVSNT